MVNLHTRCRSQSGLHTSQHARPHIPEQARGRRCNGVSPKKKQRQEVKRCGKRNSGRKECVFTHPSQNPKSMLQ